MRKRETLTCCSIYLCIHWLLLVCGLTGDQTYNLGTPGQCSNQLSYLARTKITEAKMTLLSKFMEWPLTYRALQCLINICRYRDNLPKSIVNRIEIFHETLYLFQNKNKSKK